MKAERSLEEVRNRLFTGVLSDILDSVGRPGQVADLDLSQVVVGTRVVGRAQTARAVRAKISGKRPFPAMRPTRCMQNQLKAES